MSAKKRPSHSVSQGDQVQHSFFDNPDFLPAAPKEPQTVGRQVAIEPEPIEPVPPQVLESVSQPSPETEPDPDNEEGKDVEAVGDCQVGVKAEAALIPAMDPLPLTLAEVEAWLSAAPDASSRKVRDMRTAIKVIGRVLGKPLDCIPADPKALGALVAKAAPALAQVSRENWSTVKSRLRAALRRAGFDLMPGRDTTPLTPAWRALAEALPDMRTRNGLSRLISYLSRSGIAPEGVRVEHFTAFEADLKDRSLKTNTDYLYSSIARLWNDVAGKVSGWPSVEAPVTPDPRKYSLAWDAFPPSFRMDADAFLSRAENPDVFSEHYAPGVRPSTNEGRRKHILELASALVLSGVEPVAIAALADLVRPENAKLALQWHYERNGGQTSSHIAAMSYLLLTLARHWVRDVEAVGYLEPVNGRLKHGQKGIAEKNSIRLRQFDHPDNKAALLNLPATILEEAEKSGEPTEKSARKVMMALAVEILIMAPMRIANLTQIELGRHLVETRRGKQSVFHLNFTKEETKTREPFEMELPEASVRILERYLEVYRPLLPGAKGAFLFPVEGGGKRSTIPFSTAITDFVERETGLVVNAHLFRHLAGKLYLDRVPHDIETVRRILGHRSTTTTLNNYAELRSDHAFKRYDTVVAQQRSLAQAAGRKPALRRGKSSPGAR